jgi:oligoendopeptidase F
MRSRVRSLWTALAVATLTVTAVGQERDRAKIPDTHKWNLADIYPNEAAWRAAKDKLAADIPSLGSFKGKLTASPAALADGLDRMYGVAQELGRVYSYASLLADQDTRISEHQGKRQEMVQVAAAFSAATSYVDPEILKAGKPTIDKFVAAEPRLKPYRMRLDDVMRRAAHTLSDSEEKLLADALPMAGSAGNVFGILANADFPYPTVTLSDGRSVRLDAAGYQNVRAVPNRSDREKVMSSYFTALGGFSRTYGTTLNAEAQKVLF